MPEAGGPSVQLLSRGLVRKVALGIVFVSIASGALLFYVDAGALVANVRRVSAGALGLATLLACANYAIRFARWAYYLQALAIRIPVAESALVFLAGFAMTITPAKMGEILKSLMLRESHDIPLARSGPIVVAERLTDLVGLLLLGGLGMLDVPGGGWLAAASALAVAFLIALVSWRKLWEWLVDFANRVRPAPALRRKLLDMQASLGDLVTPTKLLVGSGLSIVAWGLQGVALAHIAGAFPGVQLSLPHAMVGYCAPVLAGTLAMIPGGLGLTELSMAGALKQLGGSAMTSSIAAVVTILVRLVTFWLAILLGFVALLVWHGGRLARAAPPSAEKP